MSALKFKYKNYGPKVYRPIIPIELCRGDKSVRYEVLVDSGADLCIFDAQIGELIGLNVKKGETHVVSGITGHNKLFYLHDVLMKVGGWPKQIRAGFMESMDYQDYGVVGQSGFFDSFIVTFDFARGDIELKQRVVK